MAKVQRSAVAGRRPTPVSHNGPLKLQPYDVPPPPGRLNSYVGMHQVEEDRFQQPVCFTTKGFVSGGELISRALYAAYHSVPEGMRVVSLRCAFFLPVTKGSLDFRVERCFSSSVNCEREVVLEQRQRVTGRIAFTFRKLPASRRQLLGTVRSAPAELHTQRPEQMQRTEQLYEQFVREGGDPSWPNGITFFNGGALFEVVPAEQMAFLVGPDQPTFRHCTWSRIPFRTPDAPVYLHDLHLVALGACQMLYVTHLAYPGQRFQLMVGNDFSCWIHDHDFDTAQFLLLEMECTLHYGVNALVTGRFWSPDGRLLSTMMQECTLVPERSAPKSRL